MVHAPRATRRTIKSKAGACQPCSYHSRGPAVFDEKRAAHDSVSLDAWRPQHKQTDTTRPNKQVRAAGRPPVQGRNSRGLQRRRQTKPGRNAAGSTRQTAPARLRSQGQPPPQVALEGRGGPSRWPGSRLSLRETTAGLGGQQAAGRPQRPPFAARLEAAWQPPLQVASPLGKWPNRCLLPS